MLRQVSSDIAHDLKTPIQRVAVHLDDLAGTLPEDSAEGALLAKRAGGSRGDRCGLSIAAADSRQVEAGSRQDAFRPRRPELICAKP